MAKIGFTVICILLTVAGLTTAAIKRVKRQDLSDIMKNLGNSMQDTGRDIADNMDKTGQDVGDAFKNSFGDLFNQGSDAEDLPDDLKQASGTLFKFSESPDFENMLNTVKNNMGSDDSTSDMMKAFQGLLVNPAFLREAEKLKEQYPDENSAAYKQAMEGLVQKYFMGGGSTALVASFCTLLFALLSHRLL